MSEREGGIHNGRERIGDSGDEVEDIGDESDGRELTANSEGGADINRHICFCHDSWRIFAAFLGIRIYFISGPKPLICKEWGEAVYAHSSF